MISGDSQPGDGPDLHDNIAVEDHFTKLISKKKNQKVKQYSREGLSYIIDCCIFLTEEENPER